MAHAARTGELAEGLVISVTGKTKRDGDFKHLTDQAVRGLKDQSHARTNQFEIREKLSGLVEKFSVLNREDLAEALQSRLDELPTRSQWLPEILSLLLELSDRPVEKAKLEVLDGLTKQATAPADLTWEDIVAEDPLDEEGIWDDVERGYHSSGDDATVDGEMDSEPTTSTQATSLGEDDFAALAKLHVVHPDRSLLEDIRDHAETLKRASDNGGERAQLSELGVIRETLTMLHGLPTYLYRTKETGIFAVRDQLVVATVEDQTIQHTLTQCVDIGTRLSYLRCWITTPQNSAFMQSMQASMQRLVSNFSHGLGQLEKGYIKPVTETVVSFIGMQVEVERLARPLLRLSDVLRGELLSKQSPRSPFTLLDALYDEACLTHMAGDAEVFSAICSVFLAGLSTYLRAVGQWLRTGSVTDRDAESFLVRVAAADCGLGEFWYDRFALRELEGGNPCAPVVLHSFIKQFYATGKATAFLKALDPSHESETILRSVADGSMCFDDFTQNLDVGSLRPFEQLLEDALESWIAAVGVDRAATVRSKLLYDAGLLKTLTAIDAVFFARNGLLFQTFAEALFEQIHRHRKTWCDRFLLTELVQSTIGSAFDADADLMTVVVTDGGGNKTDMPVVRTLECLDLMYALPWPAQNITRTRTLPSHSAAFTFLLQSYYAKYLLRPQFFDLRAHLCGAAAALPTELSKALKLRNCLLCFVDSLQAHITTTASVLHSQLCTRIEAAASIDDMASIWTEYERRLQVCLMLAPNLGPIKDAVLSMLELCERLAMAWSNIELATSRSALGHVGAEFEKSISFTVAGLRGVSRAGGEAVLEALAERLAWCGG